MLREVCVAKGGTHGMREQCQALLAELSTQPVEVLDETFDGDGALRGRAAEGASLVVEHEVEAIRQRTHGVDEATVLTAPAAVQHDDRVAPAELEHVVAYAVVGHVVPLLGLR